MDCKKILMVGVILGFSMAGVVWAAEPVVPFPAALDSAAVTVAGMQNSGSESLFVGNGDLMGLVYKDATGVVIRVCKTDIWDARIDTSEDPELPKIDPATHAFSGRGDPASWSKRHYPTGVPFAKIHIADVSSASATTGRLDLARAVATVSTTGATNTVRVLSQANVFQIGTFCKVTIEEDVILAGRPPARFLPPAETGESLGVQWLRQNLPGDMDYKGMEVVVALAGKGSNWVVAVVTSREDSNPLKAAIKLAKKSLDEDSAAQVAAHERRWREYWARSGVELGIPEFQNWWYRQVYYMGCFSKPGSVAVGLKAGFDALGGWHNSYKNNYNTQQTYSSPGPVNHPELVEPLVEMFYEYLPRARWLAKTCFAGCEGAFIHSDVWPYEPDPAKCKSRNRRQCAYLPWGFSLGMNGMVATTLWEYYLYKPDQEYLKARIYPVLKDMAMFYCSLMERSQSDANGKAVLAPSLYPEQGSFGQTNTPWDVAFVTYGLKAAESAAEVLNCDTELVARIRKNLDIMPPYPTEPDPEQGNLPVALMWQGGKLHDKPLDNHCSNTQPVYPGAQVTWFSPEDKKELFKRTIRYQFPRSGKGNCMVMIQIARARLGMTGDAVQSMLELYRPCQRPNGLFYWPGHGHYISEQAGVARAITELLLQSVENIIRIFPAWPADKDARFAGLRAQGGFLVTAEQKGGKVDRVEITSTAGGKLRLVSPWSETLVNGKAVKADARGVIECDTGRNEVLILADSMKGGVK